MNKPILYDMLRKTGSMDPVDPKNKEASQPKKIYNDRNSDEYWDYLFKQAKIEKSSGRNIYNDRNSDEYWQYLEEMGKNQYSWQGNKNQKHIKEEENNGEIEKDSFMDISSLADAELLIFGDSPTNII